MLQSGSRSIAGLHLCTVWSGRQILLPAGLLGGSVSLAGRVRGTAARNGGQGWQHLAASGSCSESLQGVLSSCIRTEEP